MNTPEVTQQWISERILSDLIRSTRIHPLPSFQQSNTPIYIKREDELSSGISGSKLRKYTSLVHHLLKNEITEVALIGGPNSNNLVGLLQVLKEHHIHPWLFIREAADSTLQGNALFLEMLAPKESITSVPRNQWAKVETIANTHLESRNTQGKKTLLIPEGGLIEASLPGALTLAQDLLANEQHVNTSYPEIFIDSGTGMTAIGLILGLSALDPQQTKRRIHITLIAGTQSEFEANLDRFRAHLESEVNSQLPPNIELNFLTPLSCKAFGSIKPSLFKATREIAQTEGLLMDPIYSVKHYQAMKAYVQKNSIPSPRLFIYNGNSLGLAGFQDSLRV